MRKHLTVVGSVLVLVMAVLPIVTACTGPVPTLTPALAPTSTSRIAFTSYRDGNFEIYVMDADGSNQIRFTNNPASDTSPAWSPDGSRIAFHSWRNGLPEIYVMDANGSNQTRLTNNLVDIDSTPAWLR